MFVKLVDLNNVYDLQFRSRLFNNYEILYSNKCVKYFSLVEIFERSGERRCFVVQENKIYPKDGRSRPSKTSNFYHNARSHIAKPFIFIIAGANLFRRKSDLRKRLVTYPTIGEISVTASMLGLPTFSFPPIHPIFRPKNFSRSETFKFLKCSGFLSFAIF